MISNLPDLLYSTENDFYPKNVSKQFYYLQVSNLGYQPIWTFFTRSFFYRVSIWLKGIILFYSTTALGNNSTTFGQAFAITNCRIITLDSSQLINNEVSITLPQITLRVEKLYIPIIPIVFVSSTRYISRFKKKIN